jgi:hypothetical protein
VNNKILLSLYEKPIVVRTVLMKRSAMPENARMATLNLEMILKMINSSKLLDDSAKCIVVDNYG